MGYVKYLSELFVGTIIEQQLKMGAAPTVSETTSFILEDDKLVIDDKEKTKHQKIEERRKFSKRNLAEDEYWMLIPDAIREREFPIFQTLHAYFLDKFVQYLELKIQDDKSTSYTSSKKQTYEDLMKDIQNSQVLDRLISGRELLPTPPPKSYWHHWYELIDDGEAVCIDVTFSTYKKWVDGKERDKNVVRIDSEEWDIIDTIPIDEDGTVDYIVQYKTTDYVYRLSRMQPEDYERMLHPYQRKLVTKDSYSWKLTRFTKGESNE